MLAIIGITSAKWRENAVIVLGNLGKWKNRELEKNEEEMDKKKEKDPISSWEGTQLFGFWKTEGFRIIRRRRNLNTMESPETGISIWTDPESLKATPGLVLSETPKRIYLQWNETACQAELLGTIATQFRKLAMIATVAPNLNSGERWIR